LRLTGNEKETRQGREIVAYLNVRVVEIMLLGASEDSKLWNTGAGKGREGEV
jgi:hypothetical protein